MKKESNKHIADGNYSPSKSPKRCQNMPKNPLMHYSHTCRQNRLIYRCCIESCQLLIIPWIFFSFLKTLVHFSQVLFSWNILAHLEACSFKDQLTAIFNYNSIHYHCSIYCWHIQHIMLSFVLSTIY
jgi:hypothetical protein